MKKIKITTPENIEVEYTLAGLGSRTAALLIDSVIQGLITLLPVIAVFLIYTYARSFWYEFYGWIIGLMILCYALINYGYYIYMELSMNGMTVGKRFMKIRTIRTNGQPVTLKHSVIRNLFRVFVDSFGIGAVCIFFSKEYKRLGDMAASTIVVHEEKKTSPVTLDWLQGLNKEFSYYLNNDEIALLREYEARKESLEDDSHVSEELKMHFRKKFEALGVIQEWDDFIKGL